MSLHGAQVEALARLRAAILADVREDMQAIDELSDEHASLVETWNALVSIPPHLGKPITDADLGVF